jgi:hypothetical protein
MAKKAAPTRTANEETKKTTSANKTSPQKGTEPTRSKQKNTKQKPAVKKPQKGKQGKSQGPSFQHEMRSFVSHIESLSKALTPTMEAMMEAFEKSSNAIDSFIKKKGVMRTEQDGTEHYRIKPSDLHQFERKFKAVNSATLAVRNIPQIFLCSLVHKYDAYLGRLLRVAFSVKPEILSASEKALTYTDLAGFTSLSAARESLVEREVESVIRDSHIGHFSWMEKRFNLPLRKDLNVWPQFVEVTERRNLFVHCDGIVSSQYLNVCKTQGVKIDSDIKVGDQLNVDRTYFSKAFDCMLEIGIKLGHVLWRKLQPDDIKAADVALQETGFELLVEERYELAKKILRFATDTLKTISSDQIRRMNLINLCSAYKFSGDEKTCGSLLDSEDWSACDPSFQLAVAVHKDNFTEAGALMESIGEDGKMSRENYSTWPLFKIFRESKEFLASYRKLFGEEFVVPEDVDIQQKDQ